MPPHGSDSARHHLPAAEQGHHRRGHLPGRAGEAQSGETCHWRRRKRGSRAEERSASTVSGAGADVAQQMIVGLRRRRHRDRLVAGLRPDSTRSVAGQ